MKKNDSGRSKSSHLLGKWASENQQDKAETETKVGVRSANSVLKRGEDSFQTVVSLCWEHQSHRRNAVASSSYPSDFMSQIPSWGDPRFLKTTQGGKAPACTVINSKKLPLGTAFLLPTALGHGGSRLPPLVISAHPLLCV